MGATPIQGTPSYSDYVCPNGTKTKQLETPVQFPGFKQYSTMTPDELIGLAKSAGNPATEEQIAKLKQVAAANADKKMCQP